MTTPADICARIALLGQGVQGIARTFDPPPYNIDTADMPALMAFMGPSTDDESAGGNEYTVETRKYRVVVAVMPHGQGEPLEAERAARALIHAVKEHYRARKSLSDLAYVENTRVLGDSSIIRLPEYDGKYIGFEVILEVDLFVPKTFEDYD